MATARVLLQHVPFVRRLLTASDEAEVATVGTLAEITYLIEEEVTPAELEILEALSLEQPRDALEPYLGRPLLKVGLTCASRQYEVLIDPARESIVYHSGFRRRDAAQDEPLDASPADRARWIFDHPEANSHDDGQRAVELLLAGRDVAALAPDELWLLAKGYNWWGRNAKALEIAKLGLRREPHSSEWLRLAGLYLRSAYAQSIPQWLTACDECIAEGVGPAAFWHLLKADYFREIATGEMELEDYEWSPGDPIRHPEFLRLSADSLTAALDCHSDLREDEAARDWVGDWNTRYAALLQQPEFYQLAQSDSSPPRDVSGFRSCGRLASGNYSSRGNP